MMNFKFKERVLFAHEIFYYQTPKRARDSLGEFEDRVRESETRDTIAKTIFSTFSTVSVSLLPPAYQLYTRRDLNLTEREEHS